jgi:hypothetical protein
MRSVGIGLRKSVGWIEDAADGIERPHETSGSKTLGGHKVNNLEVDQELSPSHRKPFVLPEGKKAITENGAGSFS